MSRCPLCDAVKANLDTVEAFTLGAGLGDRTSSLEAVREMMCTPHRTKHVISMMTLQTKISTLDLAPAVPSPSATEESK